VLSSRVAQLCLLYMAYGMPDTSSHTSIGDLHSAVGQQSLSGTSSNRNNSPTSQKVLKSNSNSTAEAPALATCSSLMPPGPPQDVSVVQRVRVIRVQSNTP
jgi:hypothetical protein